MILPQFPRTQATFSLSDVSIPALTPGPSCCDLSSAPPSLLVSKHFGYMRNREGRYHLLFLMTQCPVSFSIDEHGCLSESGFDCETETPSLQETLSLLLEP